MRFSDDVKARPRELSVVKRIIVYTTGAQEWYIVSLLSDVTSPTTAVHYVTITSDLCVLSTEALAGVPTAHGVHKQEFTVKGGSTQFATEQVGRLHYVTAGVGGLEAFPLSIVIWTS